MNAVFQKAGLARLGGLTKKYQKDTQILQQMVVMFEDLFCSCLQLYFVFSVSRHSVCAVYIANQTRIAMLIGNHSLVYFGKTRGYVNMYNCSSL